MKINSRYKKQLILQTWNNRNKPKSNIKLPQFSGAVYISDKAIPIDCSLGKPVEMWKIGKPYAIVPIKNRRMPLYIIENGAFKDMSKKKAFLKIKRNNNRNGR